MCNTFDHNFKNIPLYYDEIHIIIGMADNASFIIMITVLSFFIVSALFMVLAPNTW